MEERKKMRSDLERIQEERKIKALERIADALEGVNECGKQ